VLVTVGDAKHILLDGESRTLRLGEGNSMCPSPHYFGRLFLLSQLVLHSLSRTAENYRNGSNQDR